MKQSTVDTPSPEMPVFYRHHADQYFVAVTNNLVSKGDRYLMAKYKNKWHFATEHGELLIHPAQSGVETWNAAAKNGAYVATEWPKDWKSLSIPE
jgi:nitrite reductase/ring-hydroxylating ferredoxin subunit